MPAAGVAQEWYAAELDDIQRDGMQGGHDITNWVNALTARFKRSEQAALDALIIQRYTSGACTNVAQHPMFKQSFVTEETLVFRRQINYP